jgi:hypothetical protein
MADDPYPVHLEIDYPDYERNWVTNFFRPILVIPIANVVGMVSWPAFQTKGAERPLAAGGTIFAALVLMLVFRQKYPRWWFDWNLQLVRFSTRVAAYLTLLRDEYPSTDEEQAVHIEIPYPDARELNRWLPLVKWFLAIPHYIVMAFLMVGVVFAVLFAWFSILLSGHYPRRLFDYVVGVFRYWLRVAAYAFLLTTDRYPPFRLSG